MTKNQENARVPFTKYGNASVLPVFDSHSHTYTDRWDYVQFYTDARSRSFQNEKYQIH